MRRTLPGPPHLASDPLAPFERPSAIGRYLILAEVGRGGSAEVYAAYDPELDRRVAVKFLRLDLSGGSTGEARARLSREAKAIARLSHPNVVAVYDAGSWNDRVFIAMEFVEGETLARWLQSGTRPWRDIRDKFIGAGRGLAAAHAAGLVHRDFKPQNVLIGRDGQARVADFGLARRFGALDVPEPVGEVAAMEMDSRSSSSTITVPLTRTGALLGTPTYMAPEQFRAGATDHRTDQFSFCVALYGALYGQRAFAGDTVSELRAEVLAGRVREAPPKRAVPHWLGHLVRRGLQTNPEDRYPSMAELLKDLERAPSRRQGRVVAALVLVVALVASGLVARRVVAPALICSGAEGKLAQIWETSRTDAPASRRARAHQAFLATNRSWAADAWERVARALDVYTNQWKAAYADACEATHVRGEQSTAALDLRMGCLQERLAQVKALTDILVSADAQVAMGAVDAVTALGALDRCANLPLLRAVVPPPRDEKTRAEIEAMAPRVAALKALLDTGREQEGLNVGLALVREARKVGYKPLLATTLDLVGELQMNLGYLGDTETSLSEALSAAESGRDDDIKADAAALLANALSCDSSRRIDGEHWADLGDAILDHLGHGPRQERRRAWILTARANIRGTLGDWRGDMQLEQQSLVLKERALGPDHPDVAISLSNLAVARNALGDFRGALEFNDRARTIRRRAYGEGSLWVAICESNGGETLNALGRYAEAAAAFRKALAIQEDALGPKNWQVAYPLTGLGQTQLAMGEAWSAVATLDRALRIRESSEQNLFTVAETRFALARALAKTRSDPGRAWRLARQARATYSTSPLFSLQVRQIDDWVARQPRTPRSPRTATSRAEHKQGRIRPG